MYKLFLTIRYLTRKAIVIFPILVVWLCVAMLIIVTSIMGGFVDRVRQVNRDITGDIVVESTSIAGFPYYVEMQEQIAAQVPEVELSVDTPATGSARYEIPRAGTPVIQAIGLVNTPVGNRLVQVIGMKPDEHARVTRWQKSLYGQYKAPMLATDMLESSLPATGEKLQSRGEELYKDAKKKTSDSRESLKQALAGERISRDFNSVWLYVLIPVALIEWLMISLTRDAGRKWRLVWWLFPGITLLILLGLSFLPMIPHAPTGNDITFLKDAISQNEVAELDARMTRGITLELPPGKQFDTRKSLEEALVKTPSFALNNFVTNQLAPPKDPFPRVRGAIVGVDMSAKRDTRGNFVRKNGTIFTEAVLNVSPLAPQEKFGAKALSALSAAKANIMLIDDSYTGSAEADSTYLYADFDLVQNMAQMHRQELEADDKTSPNAPPEFAPARTSMLEFKVKGTPTPAQMDAVRDKIEKIVLSFYNSPKLKKDFSHISSMENGKMYIRTWDRRQERYIGAVQNEKNMITFILGLMSLVVLVVVFLIFYIIVRDKTRDIGIIKAVGGSELGVANIFTVYGGVIGVLGGLMGVATGIAFVRHTNEIHEWIFQTFGWKIWERDLYMFDRIPDTYNIWEVGLYFSIAIVAGILGAMIPALIAGFANPVRALRHE